MIPLQKAQMRDGLFSVHSMLAFWQNISTAGFRWKPAIIMIRKGIFGLA